MNKYRFYLKGLTCSHCAMKIEEKMGSYPFVERSVMNFIAQELTITLKDESKASQLLEIVRSTVDKIEDGVTVSEITDSDSLPPARTTHTASCGCVHDRGCERHHGHGGCGHIHQDGESCGCERHQSYHCEEEHSRSQKTTSAPAESGHGHVHPKKSHVEITLLITSAVLMIAGLFFDNQWVKFAVYGVSALLAGYKIYITGFKSLIRFRFDENR